MRITRAEGVSVCFSPSLRIRGGTGGGKLAVSTINSPRSPRFCVFCGHPVDIIGGRFFHGPRAIIRSCVDRVANRAGRSIVRYLGTLVGGSLRFLEEGVTWEMMPQKWVE